MGPGDRTHFDKLFDIKFNWEESIRSRSASCVSLTCRTRSTGPSRHQDVHRGTPIADLALPSDSSEEDPEGPLSRDLREASLLSQAAKLSTSPSFPESRTLAENETVAAENEIVNVENETVAVENETVAVENETVAVKNETVAVENETVAAATKTTTAETEIDTAELDNETTKIETITADMETGPVETEIATAKIATEISEIDTEIADIIETVLAQNAAVGIEAVGSEQYPEPSSQCRRSDTQSPPIRTSGELPGSPPCKADSDNPVLALINSPLPSFEHEYTSSKNLQIALCPGDQLTVSPRNQEILDMLIEQADPDSYQGASASEQTALNVEDNQSVESYVESEGASSTELQAELTTEVNEVMWETCTNLPSTTQIGSPNTPKSVVTDDPYSDSDPGDMFLLPARDQTPHHSTPGK